MHPTAVLGQLCGSVGSMSAGIYGQRGFEVNKNVIFVEELVAHCVWHLLYKSGIGPFSATKHQVLMPHDRINKHCFHLLHQRARCRGIASAMRAGSCRSIYKTRGA